MTAEDEGTAGKWWAHKDSNLDPLIKSQLLYQLSYAPGLPRREPPGARGLAKAVGMSSIGTTPFTPSSGRTDQRQMCRRPSWPR